MSDILNTITWYFSLWFTIYNSLLLLVWCCYLHLCICWVQEKGLIFNSTLLQYPREWYEDLYHKCNVVCQNSVYDRYASSIPQGERYEGLIRHLFLAPRALSSHIVSTTPTLSIAVDINYYPGDNAAVCCITTVQCHPWQVLLFLCSRSW